MRLAVSKGYNTVGAAIILPDGNKFSFRNVVFKETLDDGQSPKT
jgi:hypothetical protein